MSSDERGVTPAKRLAICSSTSGRLCPGSSVATAPGSIVVTRTPSATPSWRRDSENAPTPNFVRLYTPDPARATRPATELTLTMWPEPCARISGRAAAEQHHAGVVDEHVQASELRLGPLHERARLSLLADVRRHRNRPFALLFDPLSERLDPLATAGRKRNRR